MNYETYKNTRNASWHCLIECKISSLPTNLSQICKRYNINIIKNSSLKTNRLLNNERATNTLIDDKSYIIVDDSDSMKVQRYSIAHEIGHILLGENTSEYEAERFAIGILAPACVLWALDLHAPEDISRLCNISLRSATIRAERMEMLYKRKKFLTSPLEQAVFSQFKNYTDCIKNDMATGCH